MDPTDLSPLIVAQYLAPFAAIGFDKLRNSFEEKMGAGIAEFVIDTSKKVWNKVAELFNKDGDEKVLERLKVKPDSEATRQLISEMLTEKLTENPAVAKELEGIVLSTGPDGKTALNHIENAGIAIIVSVQNSDFRGANNTSITGMNVNS